MFKKIFFIIVFIISFLLASGEPVSVERQTRTVYVDQKFDITLKMPDLKKYPDYYYRTVDPVLNTRYVKFLGKKELELSDDLNPLPGRIVYYFEAIEPGETKIDIYRKKVGNKSTTGLEYSILVKIEK
jgi:uncharacterized protein Usg